LWHYLSKALLITFEVIKDTIKGDGVWHIRREAKGQTIKITKIESTGTGNILCEEFLRWRQDLQAREVAKLLGG
jgi:hypothetical protein